jgi:Alcohol dehydrogenase GroES-like domain
MRAAVIREFHSPLVIEDRPVPEPGPGHVRVKIETSGVCHTDIHAANGDWRSGRPCRSSPGTRASGSSTLSVMASPASASASGSRSRGWAARMGPASTA